MPNLEEMIQEWNGLAVISRFDRPTGTWIFICIHDNSLGPSTGGTRISVYPSPTDALRDAMRLAEGMTHKWAAVDLGFGGAKAVLAIPRPLEGDERRGLLRRYGRLIDFLAGSFLTGEDMGITQDDMVYLAQHTKYLHGVDKAGNKIDPGPFTARGVFTGLQTAFRRKFGDASAAGRSVLIQGTGNVGRHLARMLAEAGAEVLLQDLDRDRAGRLANEIGAKVVRDEDVYSTPCDVFSPCAVGAILNGDTIPRLACQIVGGSANNQLAGPEDAERLHERGILYAPDFILNAGGAISFAHIDRGTTDRDTLFEKVDGIGVTLDQVLAEAEERVETTLAAATRRAKQNLARADR